MIRRLTPDEVKAILAKGTFDDLIGVLEDAFLAYSGTRGTCAAGCS